MSHDEPSDTDASTKIATASSSLMWLVPVVAAGMLTVLLIPCLIVAMLPVMQNARETARREQARENLRQIGLALHQYQATHGSADGGGNVGLLVPESDL
jgi:hypothetical protein